MTMNSSLIEKHFTATVYIIQSNKVILLYHEKLGKWLPPGGHVEPNETPPEAAHREALEETGYQIQILQDEHIWVDRWNAKSFERPILCLLEEIPAHKGLPAHQHMDMVFVATPVSQGPCLETQKWRWFTLDEIHQLESDKDIFKETKSVLTMIFDKFSVELSHA